MKYRVAVTTMMLMLIWAGTALGGWVIQEAMDEGESTLYFHKNQIKVEADEIVQIFNLRTNKLSMINPTGKVYWQGEASEVKKGIQSAMEESLKGLPKEQREAALKMMQSNYSAGGGSQDIKVNETGETDTIGGYKAKKYEVLVDGELKEELWLAPKINLAKEIDFIKLGNMMETFNMGEPEASYESNPKVMGLYKIGYPVKRVTHQDGDTMLEKVVKAEKKSLSDSQFSPTAGYKKVTFQEFQEAMMSMQ